MKIVFVSDLHSSKNLYEELKNLLCNLSADALIVGGDLFAYSDTYKPQVEFIEEYLLEYFKNIDIPIYIIHGNCDCIKTIEVLKEKGYVKFLDINGMCLIKNLKLYGYSTVPLTPFRIKDHEKRDLKGDRVNDSSKYLITNKEYKLEEVSGEFFNSLHSVEEEISTLRDKNSIWVMHSPPYGGKLDLNFEGAKGGSKAIRKQIENTQPLLTLHGHIHESPEESGYWYEKIGDTICINAGSCKERLHAVAFTIDERGELLNIEHNIFGKYEV